MIRHIPNFITLCNLMCGTIGIIYAVNGELFVAKYLMWAGIGFDFLDGLVARALKADSPIGKQLDSLSDMVSFGVLPGIMCWMYLFDNMNFYDPILNGIIPLIALMVPAFAALRLAMFNIDTTQSNNFKGIPSTFTAFFLASVTTVDSNFELLNRMLANKFFLIGCIIISSFLMVSKFRFMAMKFKGGKNYIEFLFIGIVLGLVLLFRNEGIVFSYFIYILLSGLFQNVLKDKI